jgi:hypothetical protein
MTFNPSSRVLNFPATARYQVSPAGNFRRMILISFPRRAGSLYRKLEYSGLKKVPSRT